MSKLQSPHDTRPAMNPHVGHGSGSAQNTPSKPPNPRAQSEEVPDSEVDAPVQRSRRIVIEISSDEAESLPPSKERGSGSAEDVEADFLGIPGAWSEGLQEKGPDVPATPKYLRARPKKPKTLRVIYSSSSEESCTEIEVNETSGKGSSHDMTKTRLKASSNSQEKFAGSNGSVSAKLPLFADDSEEEVRLEPEPYNIKDDSILVLNEPRSARKPLRLPSSPADSKSVTPSRSNKFKWDRSIAPVDLVPSTSGGPSYNVGTSTASTLPNGRRPYKKALEAARQASLEVYAAELFAELNELVFGGRLPRDTKLNWNKRLTGTAGKASYHRSKNGVVTTEIQLSNKILTSEERIRNTLSHELCHLATWLIDGDIREGHGPLWKAWVTKVMRARRDIEISTRHHYEIEYTYTWKCVACAKIYGRFSKSIDPQRQICGACRIGQLIPQFPERSRKASTTKTQSQMAAASPQGSPHTVLRGTEAEAVSTPTRGSPSTKRIMYLVDSDDDEADIGDLTTSLRNMNVSASTTKS